MNIKKIEIKELFNIVLLFYFVTLSSFRLGYGIDPIVKKIALGMLIVGFFMNYKKIKINKSTLYLLLFWLFYFLSLLWASSRVDVLDNINEAIYIIILSVILSTYINDMGDIINILKLLVYSLLITVVILFIRTPFQYFGTERIGDALGLHPNALGSRMAYGAIISVFLLSNDKSKNLKKIIFYILCIFIFAVIAILTGSKLSIFITVAGIVAYEILITKGYKVLLKIAIIFGIIYVIYSFIISNPMLYKLIGSRIENFFLSLQGVSATKTGDVSTYERKYYIYKAIELFKSNPIIGYGGNNFRTFMGEISYSHVTYSHNNYLEMLSTLGIVGFAFYYYPWVKNLVTLIFSKTLKVIDKYKLKYLFITIFAVKLIADYATITYNHEFLNVLFVLAFCYIKITKNLNIKRNENTHGECNYESNVSC